MVIDLDYYRQTIHPILHRLGVDSLVGCVSRLREDERFKSVGPDAMVFSYPPSPHIQTGTAKPDAEVEGEIWFDWTFVDFWKSNYCMFSAHSNKTISPFTLLD